MSGQPICNYLHFRFRCSFACNEFTLFGMFYLATIELGDWTCIASPRL